MKLSIIHSASLTMTQTSFNHMEYVHAKGNAGQETWFAK